MTKKIKTYYPTDECAKCKGRCCKHMGCHYSPEDFPEISFEYLKKEIEKGAISIDWWEGEAYSNEYYLRARHVGAPIVDPSWGGVCVNLTDTGCKLPFEDRPLGAKALKPRESEEESCKTSYSKEDSKNDWLKYYDVLAELVVYFRGF